MALLRMALWALVILLLLRLIGRLFRASFEIKVITPNDVAQMRRQWEGGRAANKPPAAEMVQDPVCGAWIAPAQAIRMDPGAVPQFFCSQKCLDDFRKKLNG